MPILNKRQLFHVFESSVRDCGWNLLYLQAKPEHPAQYQLYRDDQSFRVRVYIWNLTPGGKNRPEDEWRIQVTGLEQFEAEPNGKTLIMGWQSDMGLFVGFDFAHHNGQLGASPSIQIREAALDLAAVHGFSPHNKGNGELAIAFKPGFLMSYIENLESLHACGESDAEIDLLEKIGEEPAAVDDSEIQNEVGEERQYAVFSAKRALRKHDFRTRVLTAYDSQCAMCGIQLDLLDAAHILPVAHAESTDETDNGIALCALHHRAYDRAFVTFDPNFEIKVNDRAAKELEEMGHAGGLEEFVGGLQGNLILPSENDNRPSKKFIETANAFRGWAL